MRISAGTAMPGRQPGSQRASISRQVKQQRRGYAQAVLRALARSQQGRPTPQVQRVLRDALSPLGVRVSPAARDPAELDHPGRNPHSLTCRR